VLGAVLWWRSAVAPTRLPAYPPLLVAIALLAAGALIPAKLAPVQRAWMSLAHLISRVTTPIFMAVVYFGVIAPIGLVMRAAGHRPLRRPATDGSFWVVRAVAEQRTDIERQF
jgi:hypothetical protein